MNEANTQWPRPAGTNRSATKAMVRFPVVTPTGTQLLTVRCQVYEENRTAKGYIAFPNMARSKEFERFIEHHLFDIGEPELLKKTVLFLIEPQKLAGLIDGRSLYLALTLAVHMAVHADQGGGRDVIATGVVEDDHSITAVKSIEAKARAVAAAKGLRDAMFFYPSANMHDIPPDCRNALHAAGVASLPVTSIEEALAHLFGHGKHAPPEPGESQWGRLKSRINHSVSKHKLEFTVALLGLLFGGVSAAIAVADYIEKHRTEPTPAPEPSSKKEPAVREPPATPVPPIASAPAPPAPPAAKPEKPVPQASEPCLRCPQEILITRPGQAEAQFAIMRDEVTRGEFERFARATNREPRSPCHDARSDSGDVSGVWEGASTDGSDLPAICLSQGDAMAYATWLSRETGKIYRLPTIEEWKEAAGALSFQDKEGRAMVNCVDCSAQPAGRPLVAGQLAPNPYGARNLYGNVKEWTSSCDTNVGHCYRYAVVGGSWASSMSELARPVEYITESAANNAIGFRVVRELRESSK